MPLLFVSPSHDVFPVDFQLDYYLLLLLSRGQSVLRSYHIAVADIRPTFAIVLLRSYNNSRSVVSCAVWSVGVPQRVSHTQLPTTTAAANRTLLQLWDSDNVRGNRSPRHLSRAESLGPPDRSTLYPQGNVLL